MSERIPVLDLERLQGDPTALAGLDGALREWGFFHLVGHGIAPGVVAELHRQMHAFFALPAERKRAVERTENNSWGWYDRELTKRQRDWKQIFDVGPEIVDGPLAGHAPQWPDADLPSLRPACEAYASAAEGVALLVLDAIGRCFGAEPDVLRRSFVGHTSFLRLNWYPLCAEPAPADTPTSGDGTFGIRHHTDAGALTVLTQDDQPGLQVLRDGRWTVVDPIPDALVINIGDVVQVWSNDRYPAALHRVLASRLAVRYSAPYFFNPSAEADYAPLPGACSGEDPPRYRPINWGAFRTGRHGGDYADHGEELQISDFRTHG